MRKLLGGFVAALLVVWITAALIYHARHGDRPADFSRLTSLRVPHASPHPAAPTAPPPPQPAIHTTPSPAEQRELATVACGQSLDPQKHTVACPVCPRGSDLGPHGASSSGEDGWTFHSTLFGHFTSAAADEALVRVEGCETLVSNNGGDFLLRRNAGHWILLRYIHAGIADASCQTLPWPQPSGPDAVLCQTGDLGRGTPANALILTRYSEQAPTTEPTGEHNVFLMLADETGDCGPNAGSSAGESFPVGALRSWRLLPPSANGLQDLEVHAELRTLHTDDGTHCELSPPDPITLLFRNLGDHFQAPDSTPGLSARERRGDLSIGETVTAELY